MFGSTVKVKIEGSLYARLEKAAVAGGYASTEEFIVHVLDQEVANLERSQDDDEIKKQLRGLGYIE